jgi:hypothetical protein
MMVIRASIDCLRTLTAIAGSCIGGRVQYAGLGFLVTIGVVLSLMLTLLSAGRMYTVSLGLLECEPEFIPLLLLLYISISSGLWGFL